MRCNASKLGRLALSEFISRPPDQAVELPRFQVGLDLPVPTLILEPMKPISELRKSCLRQILNSGF